MKNKLLWVSIALTLFALSAAILISQKPSFTKEAAYPHPSREAALADGLLETTGENPSSGDINDWIMDSVASGAKEYILFVIPYEEAGIPKHDAFVALVEEKQGKYAFFKLTADVALNSPGDGDGDDQLFTDSLVSFFDDVEGYYVCVGKVFRDDVVPYANGQRLSMNRDGIFSYISQGKRPEVAIQEP